MLRRQRRLGKIYVLPRLLTYQEHDGRWIAEWPKRPGCLAYGATEIEAMRNVLMLRNRILLEEELERMSNA